MKALITGITGQDGRYLSRYLFLKGYEIYGLVRNTNIRLPDQLEAIYGDICDPPSLPIVDEVYNLAAFTHVGESFRNPAHVMRVNAIGATKIIEYAKQIKAKIYQASTSELFGNSPPPQNEDTPMQPVSPYGVSKLAAHQQIQIARKRGVFACTGILFNHESPLRGHNFVTQKVCRAAARGQRVALGNLDARRDWGHAEDYVRGMWQIMQQDTPDDYVLATGESRSIRDLCATAYGPEWAGYVDIDIAYHRPIDVNYLQGDASKAAFWKPRITFPAMIHEMMAYEDNGEFWPPYMLMQAA